MGGTASGGIDDPIFVKGDEGILYLINHTGCPLCHTIPGIDGAVGELGPKLTKKNMELSFENPEYKGKAKNLREYVVESILKPSAYVVYNIEEDEPYPEGLMPSTFREQMTDNALNKIVIDVLPKGGISADWFSAETIANWPLNKLDNE